MQYLSQNEMRTKIALYLFELETEVSIFKVLLILK